MKRIAAIVLIVLVGIGICSARAEQAEPNRHPALQNPPKLIIRPEDLFPPTHPLRLGMLTMVPPQKDGEVVRVSIPIGELLSRAAQAFSDANHRRAERKADERVRKDLEQFIAAAANGRDATSP